MQFQQFTPSGDKYAISFEIIQGFAFTANCPASIDAKQCMETVLSGLVTNQFSLYFRIQKEPLNLEILTSCKQFRSISRFITEYPEWLPRRSTALHVHHIQGSFNMQRTFCSVLINTVIIIKAIGDITALLYLYNQASCPYCMDCSRFYEKQVIFLHRDMVEIFCNSPFVNAFLYPG